MTVSPLIFRKGLDRKQEVAHRLTEDYHSELVAQLRAHDRTHRSGRVTVHLAEEFAYLAEFSPTPRQDPWRRTSGIHRLKGRRAVAAVRELWLTRDEVAVTRRRVTRLLDRGVFPAPASSAYPVIPWPPF